MLHPSLTAATCGLNACSPPATPRSNYGGKPLFYGQVSTLKIPVIHNGSVRDAVVEEGRGRILVIDGESLGAQAGMFWMQEMPRVYSWQLVLAAVACCFTPSRAQVFAPGWLYSRRQAEMHACPLTPTRAGEASMKCVCLGDVLAGRAAAHGWAGIVVNGCIRDAITIAKVPIGMKALGTHPQKPGKKFPGTRDVPVTVGGVTINAGDWLYCDEDGMLVSPHELDLAALKK